MYEDPKNVKTGKILAIIGIVLNVIYLLMTIWAYSYIGWENMQDPEKIQELLEQLQ